MYFIMQDLDDPHIVNQSLENKIYKTCKKYAQSTLTFKENARFNKLYMLAKNN